MRLLPRIYLVGSGRYGFGLTHRLDCNVYLLQGDEHLVLVDAGVGLDSEAILRLVVEEGLKPEQIGTILVTHSHADHAGGAAYLAQLTGAKVIASLKTTPILRDGDTEASQVMVAKKAGLYPENYDFRPCLVHQSVVGGDVLSLAGLAFTVIETPGHSHDHTSFLVTLEGRRVLLAGDSVFHSGRILMQNTADCSLQDYSHTARLLAREQVDIILPGHMSPVLADGESHLLAAHKLFKGLGVPKNII